MSEDLTFQIDPVRVMRLVRRTVALSAVAAGLLSSPSLFALGSMSAEDAYGIVAVQENGRTVYVNSEEPSPRPAPAVAAAPKQRTSYLVYWSTKENRWKPVPAPSASAVKAARTAAGEVASYVDSRPVLPGPSKTRATVNPNYLDFARGRAVSTAEIDAAIAQAAKRHGVDPNLVRAMIKVESNFNPRAVSSKGAMGLMQLMPETARGLKVTNPFDPGQNVDAGVRYFKNLMNSYGGDVKLSLAAYNAGAKNVAQAKGVPRFAETQNYVKQITNMYWNGGPAATFNGKSDSFSAPAKMFRGADGKLVITNLE